MTSAPRSASSFPHHWPFASASSSTRTSPSGPVCVALARRAVDHLGVLAARPRAPRARRSAFATYVWHRQALGQNGPFLVARRISSSGTPSRPPSISMLCSPPSGAAALHRRRGVRHRQGDVLHRPRAEDRVVARLVASPASAAAGRARRGPRCSAPASQRTPAAWQSAHELVLLEGLRPRLDAGVELFLVLEAPGVASRTSRPAPTPGCP